MSSGATLLRELQEGGVQLSVRNGELRYRARRGFLTREHLNAMRAYRESLIELLTVGSPAEERDSLPMSYAQEYFATSYDRLKDPTVQHPWTARQLIGEFDLQAWQMSCAAVARRHVLLRARYRPEGERLRVVVEPSLAPVVEVVNLVDLDPLERSRALAGAARGAIRRRFDLLAGPLWRLLIVRLGSGNHVIVTVVHHSIADAWSLGVLWRDLTASYGDERSGQPRPPAEPDDTFFRHVGRLRRWVDEESCGGHIQYWTGLFANAREPYYLPSDQVGLNTDGAPSPAARVSVLSGSTEALRTLARSERTTLSVLVLAAVTIELSRWSGRRDIFVAVHHSGRPEPELQQALGCFVEAWVLKADISDNPSFVECVRRTRDAYLEALPHLGVPYWKIKEQLTQASGAAGLVDIAFNYIRRELFATTEAENRNGASIDVSALRVADVPIEVPLGGLEEPTGMKLLITVAESDTSLEWMLQYSRETLSVAAIEAFAAGVRYQLERAASTTSV